MDLSIPDMALCGVSVVSIWFNGSGPAVHTNGAALVPGPIWVSERCRAQLVLLGASSSLSVPHVTPLEQKFGTAVTSCPTSTTWSHFWLSTAKWWISAALQSCLDGPQHRQGPESLPLFASQLINNPSCELQKLSELKLTSSEAPELTQIQAFQAA